jgi:hypothetical protein
MSEYSFTPLKGKNAFLKGWQEEKLTYEEAKNMGGTGVGIVHGLSNTCCIDIDEIGIAKKWFDKFDIDVYDLLKSGYRVYSPNDKSEKAIFGIPANVNLPKLTVKDDDTGIQFIEFRSGGHQDAFPGSQYHFKGKGFDEWENTFYTTDKKSEDCGIVDLPLEVVRLWKKLAANTIDDKVKAAGSHTDSGEDVDDIVAIITRGTAGLHDAINKYAYMQIKDGIAPKMVISTIKGLLMAIPEGSRDGRWTDYYEDVPRSVEGAIEKTKETDGIKAIEYDCDDMDFMKRTPMPWPPGLMGELANNAYDMQRYQYKEVAVVSAIGVVAGIAGRKFNISGTGLNVYLTLIMSTGMGKDSIREFICGTINRLNDTGNSSSFVGPGRFTGPKAVFSALKNSRCRVSVFTEAGLLLRSSAGDQDGLTRALLQLYSCSGSKQFSMEEVYSKGDESIESMQAPCLTIVNEATPETLLGAFKNSGALENGHLPRQSIYRIIGDKPYMNFDVKNEIDQHLRVKLKSLINKCSTTQSSNEPSAWNMVPDEAIRDDIYALSQYYTDIENENRDDNTMKSIMASRCLLKALKFAAIASVFNHEDAVIRAEEWKWAKDMVAFEMAGVENFFQGSGYNSDMDSLSMGIVGMVILKILNGHYKDRQQQMSTAERKKGYIKVSILRRILKNNKMLSDINDDQKFKSNPKTGLDKCLHYMVENGYLKWVNAGVTMHDKRIKSDKYIVQITDMFNAAMQEVIL